MALNHNMFITMAMYIKIDHKISVLQTQQQIADRCWKEYHIWILKILRGYFR